MLHKMVKLCCHFADLHLQTSWGGGEVGWWWRAEVEVQLMTECVLVYRQRTMNLEVKNLSFIAP